MYGLNARVVISKGQSAWMTEFYQKFNMSVGTFLMTCKLNLKLEQNKF